MTRTAVQVTYRVLWYAFAVFFLLDCISFLITGPTGWAAYTGLGSLLLFAIPRMWPGWWQRKTGSSDVNPSS